MRFRKGRTGVILVLGLGLALCLWASGDARAEAVYTIGVLQPFSGVYATLGEEAYAGCQVAADELNSTGGYWAGRWFLSRRTTSPMWRRESVRPTT